MMKLTKLNSKMSALVSASKYVSQLK